MPSMPNHTRDPSCLWDRVADDARRTLLRQQFKRFKSLTEEMAVAIGISRKTLYREVERLGLREELDIGWGA